MFRANPLKMLPGGLVLGLGWDEIKSNDTAYTRPGRQIGQPTMDLKCFMYF